MGKSPKKNVPRGTGYWWYIPLQCGDIPVAGISFLRGTQEGLDPKLLFSCHTHWGAITTLKVYKPFQAYRIMIGSFGHWIPDRQTFFPDMAKHHFSWAVIPRPRDRRLRAHKRHSLDPDRWDQPGPNPLVEHQIVPLETRNLAEITSPIWQVGPPLYDS